MLFQRIVPIAALGAATGLLSAGLSGFSQPAEAGSIDTITVVAEPSEAAERALHVGDVQINRPVPFQVRVASDGSMGITIDPDDVPTSAYGDNGQVTLHIQRVDAKGRLGSETTSLRRDPTDDQRWVSPDDEPSGARTRAPGFRTFWIKFTMHTPSGQNLGRAGRFADTSTDEGDPRPAASPKWTTYTSSTDAADIDPSLRGVEYCPLRAHAPVWATIATSYPINNNRSWLNYTNTISTVSGTAVTLGSSATNFRTESTKSTQDAWGQDFTPSPYNRSYRIQIDYGLYECVNTITGYRWWKTEPRFQTGGTAWQWLDPAKRPKWYTCAPVSQGTWWRGATRGNDYSLSYGVKIADLIGINLSSQHRYSSAGRLNYAVTGSPKRLCGNGGSMPAQAAKVIERYR